MRFLSKLWAKFVGLQMVYTETERLPDGRFLVRVTLKLVDGFTAEGLAHSEKAAFALAFQSLSSQLLFPP